MSDTMRWILGETNNVAAAVDSATVIEIGDLLWQDVGNAKPASSIDASLPIPGTHRNLQEYFACLFLGVAMQRSRAGDNRPIRVAATGVFEFDCLSSMFELGDLVGACFLVLSGGLGDGLANQFVTTSGNGALGAVGRVAQRAASATTSGLVDVRSTVMTGGIISKQ